MKVGISVCSSYPHEPPKVAARHMIERTRAAREAGLNTLFVGDHHVTPTNYLQNNVILGRMLAEWGDQPFGALYLLPLWHPVLLAEQIGTLASLASGPFVMQCGLGDKRQCRAFGIDPAQRVGRFTASLSILRALWAGEVVNESDYWGLHQARIAPVPEQSVDVWVGAVVEPAIERTARLGDGWLAAPSLTYEQANEGLKRYQHHCAQLNRTPGAMAIRRDFLLGSTSQDAKAIARPYLESGYRGIPTESLLIGSVAELVDQIGQLEGLGYSEVIVRNISQDQAECLHSIQLLREVKEQLGGSLR